MAQPQQRPAVGVVRFYNFLPASDSFLDDVLTGFASEQTWTDAAGRFSVHGMIAV